MNFDPLTLLSPKVLQQVLIFAAIGGLFGLFSHIVSPQRETLQDVPVRSDFVGTDDSFVDAILMLKPYRAWDAAKFDMIVERADALAFYLMRVSDPDRPIDLKMQFYALAAKRQIHELSHSLVDKVSRNMPEEAVVAKENMEALFTVVDTYVDNIQTECIENVKLI